MKKAEAEKEKNIAELKASDETKTKEQRAKDLADKESLFSKEQREKLGKMKVSQMRILDSFSPLYEFE